MLDGVKHFLPLLHFGLYVINDYKERIFFSYET